MTYVAFLRAINVAGHATLRMTDVCAAFAAAGARDVRTCIQSGNVIFEAPVREVAAIVRSARSRLRSPGGGEPQILLRSITEIEKMVRRNPFEHLPAGPAVKFYVAFLFEKPHTRADLPLVSSKEALEAIAIKDREVFVVSRPRKNGFFGFPNNFVEHELGVQATTRNWSTIRKILELVR